MPFNDAFVNFRAKQIEKLPEIYKKAILLWYDGCKRFIANQFPNVFKASDDAEEQETGTTFRSYMKLVDSLADSDVPKKEQIRQSYLFDVLESLEQTSIKAQKQQEEINKIRNQ